MAGAYNDALSALGSAVQKTQTGQQVQGAVNNYLKKAQNINLLGSSPTQAANATAGAATAQKAAPVSLSVKNGNTLELNKGNFQSSLSRGGAQSKYNLGGGFGLQANMNSKGKSIGAFFQRSF